MITTLIAAGARSVPVPLGTHSLPGTLAWPEHPSGVVLLVHGDNLAPQRGLPALARHLRAAGLATLVFDPLIPGERKAPSGELEAALLADRLRAATDWVLEQPEVVGLMPGYLGSGIGGGAALRCAAADPALAGAVVICGGRPDLAGEALYAVRAPALFLAGARDEAALEASRQAYRCLDCTKRLVVITGASGTFEEPGTLAEVGRWAAEWFVRHLVMAPHLAAYRRSAF